MYKSRHEQYTQELQDTQLSALLREAYAQDPALEEAPGRTERIMRQVLAAAPARPAPAPWAIWGWATGLAGAAAAAVFALLLMHSPQVTPIATVPSAPIVTPAPISTPPTTTPRTLPSVQTPVEQPRHTWHASNDAPAHMTPKATPAPEETGDSTTAVAAALYTAGTAAHAEGDYATAYQAYRASYETEPNPDTLLAASDALLHMDGGESGS